jgi:hypothetical protein
MSLLRRFVREIVGFRGRRTTKGAIMPTVIAYHEVKDTQHWLASPKREEVFGPLGVTNIRTFVNQENPNRVALLMEVDDLEALAKGDGDTRGGKRCELRHSATRHIGDPHGSLTAAFGSVPATVEVSESEGRARGRPRG